MIHESVKKLEYLLVNVPQLLHALPDKDFDRKPAPDKWSKKEIIGHLIDSACNNHQRLIRAQYEAVPHIAYDQNKWNSFNYYATAERTNVLNLWEAYNRQLLHLICNTTEDQLQLTCYTGLAHTVTLEWIIEDYIKHLEHHLRQIIAY